MSKHLHHLISLAQLDRTSIIRLLDRAERMRTASLHGTHKLDLLSGRTVLNLFFEPSTRTRTSFELAARRLSADVVNFDIARSSTNKGETLLDTLHTLEAMHLDAIVVRHRESGTPQFMMHHAMSGVSVVNAGDGHHAHPTQGLLDALTIRQHYPDFSKLTVTICGDICHSRVARSDIHALAMLGVRKLRLCGPASLLPEPGQVPHGHLTEDFDAAVEDADVIIMLRLQKERMAATLMPDKSVYFKHYGLDTTRLQRAAPGCLVMHPGPINRGIEIAPEVADGAQSRILEQVSNGVFVRMAVLAEVLRC